MSDRDAQEQQALIDDIINNLTGGAPPQMRIIVDLEREIIRIAPLESLGIETDFTYRVNCAGTCRLTFELALRRRDYDLWRSRTVVIQRCFPYLTPPFRELLITGLCPAGWRQMFARPEGQESLAERPVQDEPLNQPRANESTREAVKRKLAGRWTWRRGAVRRLPTYRRRCAAMELIGLVIDSFQRA